LLVITAALLSPLLRGPHAAPVFDHILPPDEPSQQGQALARLAFPVLYSQASAILVFAREPHLTPADLQTLRNTLEALQNLPDAKSVPGFLVTSHLTEPILTKRLLALDASNQPRAALLVVSFDLPYDSDASVQLVERIDALVKRLHTDPSLTLEVTGPADKIDSLLTMIRPYGIKEVARTGMVAMSRGSSGSGLSVVRDAVA